MLHYTPFAWPPATLPPIELPPPAPPAPPATRRSPAEPPLEVVFGWCPSPPPSPPPSSDEATATATATIRSPPTPPQSDASSDEDRADSPPRRRRRHLEESWDVDITAIEWRGVRYDTHQAAAQALAADAGIAYNLLKKACRSVIKGHGFGPSHPAPFGWHQTASDNRRGKNVSVWGRRDGTVAVVLAIGQHVGAGLDYEFSCVADPSVPRAASLAP